MKIIGKALEYLYYLVLLFIAFILISSAFPLPGGFKSYVVLSGSMEPVIKTGSIVVIRNQADYSIGDVITFGKATKDNPPTTHRIVDVERENNFFYYTTKGDANNDVDAKKISSFSVIGKVLFSIPFVGYAIAAAQKPIGFILLVGVPALALIIIEIQKIVGEVKNRKKEGENN